MEAAGKPEEEQTVVYQHVDIEDEIPGGAATAAEGKKGETHAPIGGRATPAISSTISLSPESPVPVPLRRGIDIPYSDAESSDDSGTTQRTTGASESWSIYDVDSDQDDLGATGGALPQEWVRPKAALDDGTATELVVAHSIEHRVFKSGPEMIALVCSSGPPAAIPTAQEQQPHAHLFRWL
jgi:hypothetical protein